MKASDSRLLWLMLVCMAVELSDKKREKRKKTVRNREKKRPKVKVMTISTHLSSRFIFSDDGKDKQSDNTSNIEL